MSKFGTSQSVPRKEDVRFLTGRGRYLDDVAPEGAAHAVFFRSPVAHARIAGLDVGEAAAAARGAGGLSPPPTSRGGSRTRWTSSWCATATARAAPRRAGRCWPTTRVRYAGEAIAVVVAETRAAAMDAVELIACDFDDLPVHVATAGGRPADPPRGAGQRRLRLGLRRRGGGGGGLRGGGAYHAARADRQPGDGDADGAARLLRRVGRGAAARRLLRPGGLGAEGRAGREARPRARGGAGDDARRRRRLRDQGLQPIRNISSSPSPRASSAGRCTG